MYTNRIMFAAQAAPFDIVDDQSLEEMTQKFFAQLSVLKSSPAAANDDAAPEPDAQPVVMDVWERICLLIIIIRCNLWMEWSKREDKSVDDIGWLISRIIVNYTYMETRRTHIRMVVFKSAGWRMVAMPSRRVFFVLFIVTFASHTRLFVVVGVQRLVRLSCE